MLLMSRTAITVLTLLFFGSQNSFAGYPVISAPVKTTSERLGLNIDTAFAIEFLRTGMPELEPAVTSVDALTWRLAVMFECVKLLKDPAFAEQAIPVLRHCITQPLPEGVQEHLVASAGLGQMKRTWSEWDAAIASGRFVFRFECAKVLVELDKEQARPMLRELVINELPRVRSAILNDPQNRGGLHEYSWLCQIAADCGVKEGVDALVELAPLCASSPQNNSVVFILDEVLGDPYRLVHWSRAEELEAAAKGLGIWWKANRDGFTKSMYAKKPNVKRRNVARMRSVRDHLEAATVVQHGDDTVTEIYPEAREWLEKHAAKHAPKLRAIAEDKNEHPEVRNEARHWYAKVGGKKAREWLVVRLFEINPSIDPIEGNIFYGLLAEYYSESLLDIARKSMENPTPATVLIMERLVLQGEGAFVLEQYPALSSAFPSAKYRLIQWFGRKPCSGDEIVLNDCLLSDDWRSVVLVCAAVQRGGKESLLSDEARSVFTQKMTDPAIRIEILQLDEWMEVKPEEVAEVLNLVGEIEPSTSYVYSSAIKLLQRSPKIAPDSPELARCTEGLRACVAAYRAQRQP